MKYNSILSFMIFIVSALAANCQVEVYDINVKKDIPTLGVGLTLTVIGEVLVRKSKPPTALELNLLSKQDINKFDKGAASNNSQSAQTISDVLLFSAVSIPLLSYFSPECRNNDLDIAILGLETLLINNGITNILKGSVRRLRPTAYNENFELDSKLTKGTRQSFISGHASNTAAMSFFAARVFTDLYPEMNHKELIWIPAAVLPATISYLRVKAGKHFPTDVIAGYVVGAVVGYAIPTIHKNNNLDINLSPLGGLSLTYKLK